eukprot:jgi/Undpi1/9659/HiC_scaffold_27.g12115.m1
MHQSIEEDEVTAQRDAAVSLFKGLQERIRTQAAEYEARTEAAEMGRIKYEILLEKLQLEESGSAMTARAQVRTVTQGWAIGTVLGWSAGLLLGCLFSPVLGFMLVLPFVAAGVVGGLTYAQLRDKMRSLRREKLHSTPSMDKEEFLRQLQGRSDPSATGGQFGADGNALPSGSFLRRVAMGAARVLVRSALDVTITAVSSMLGFGGGGSGGGDGGGGGGRDGRDLGRTGTREG